MKRTIIPNIVSFLIILLFVYTSTSKFLDYDKFVFQMRLAPVPLMKILAPILGWVVPAVEMVVAISLAVGFFFPAIKMKGLFGSVYLLSIFEIYIAIMLLSGSHLPCTCGGIVSQMGWKQHLFFNAFFIICGILSIKYSKKQKTSPPIKFAPDENKILSRA
jgi:putative oxidoreductase